MNHARLRRLGISSWALLGIITLVVVLAVLIGAIRGVVVPLVIAVIIGAVLEPLVEWLELRGVRPTFAAVIALVVAASVAIGVLVIVVWGFLSQLPEISTQLVRGWDAVVQWTTGLDIDAVWLERARATVQDYAPRVGEGILGAVSSTFSGAFSFGIGTFFAVFLLFFVLRDARRFPAWLAGASRLDPRAVAAVATAAKESIRGYFKGIAVTALITAPIFMIPLLLLKVPLALPIFILYLFLSFIPFIGAWITGAFAILIAFGTGGASAALIVALSLLVSNGTIQSAVSSWALGSSLRIHPVAVLLATLVGGTIAGTLGMILGAPLVAATQRAAGALREIRQEHC